MNGMEVRIARIRRRMRQYELARELGLRDSELSLIESGRKAVPIALIPRLAELLPDLAQEAVGSVARV